MNNNIKNDNNNDLNSLPNKKMPQEVKEMTEGISEMEQKTIEVGKDMYDIGKAGVKTTVAFGKEVAKIVSYPITKRRSIADFFVKSKRGLITGAADNDPAGIVTCIQTGATAGFNLLWLVPLSWPLLVVVEGMSAKIGIVTKKGVNQNIIEHFGLPWAYLAMIIVFICNIATISADIAAMADIFSIITNIPVFWFILLLGALFLVVMIKNKYDVISRYLFVLTPFLLFYVLSALMFDVPWGEALKATFVPAIEALNANFYMIALAFLGTTLTPFLIFWEANEQIEEKQEARHLAKEKMSVVTGMFFTIIISFFIVITGAVAFSGAGGAMINSAKEAALALEPLGKWAFLFFSLGILGSGFISVPVLAASTGYVVSETLNWKAGLSKEFNKAKKFYWVIISAIVIGGLIALLGLNPIKMLVYSQVLNGILMPILVILLLRLCNNKKVMGEYTNHWWTNVFGYLTVVILILFVVLMFINWNTTF